VSERDDRIDGLNQAVAERDDRIDGLNQAVAERDDRIDGLNQAVAERDERIDGLNQAVAERDDRIDGLNQAVAERDDRIDGLNQAVTERDDRIDGLNQAVAERNDRIDGLNQAVAERDERINGLNQAVTERNDRNNGLNQAVTERDERINGLNQAVTERDRWLAERDAMLAEAAQNLMAVDQQMRQVQRRVDDMEKSRSWRITAPYRSLGAALKAVPKGLVRTGFFSRVVVAFLLLPAAIVFYGGFFKFFSALRLEKSIFANVIAGQAVIRERLLNRGRLVRRFVFLGFSLALRIQRSGSVKRSFRNFVSVIRTEGLTGLRGRLIAAAPSVGAQPKLVDHLMAGPAERPTLAKDVAKRILVADYRVPRPDVSAGERATVGILRDLVELGYEVVFLPNDMMQSPVYEAELLALGTTVVTRDSGFAFSAHYVEQHGAEFGIFYIIRVDVAETILPIIRRVAPSARVIFHAPDLYFLREMREAGLRQDQAAHERAIMTRDREVAMMSRADLVVVVSTAEVPVLQEVLPNTPVAVFPVLYAPVIAAPQGYSNRENIFFLGGFGHSPNVNAVEWFANEVWPHVREALPKVEFQIIGAEAPEPVLALGDSPGIKVVGFVQDLNPVLETLRLGVAPLLYGAGIKGKVAVTMGAGIPCVCTEIAAEGMGIKNDVHALVENDPVRFAQAVVSLYQNEVQWTRLSKEGQMLVQDKFGHAANRAALLKVLDQAQALPISLFCDYCQTAEPMAVPNPGAQSQIDVSIIVPVYNKWNLTRACLTSVVQTSVGSGVSYEVILADDGSVDETQQAADIFPGLRVARTPKNVGFLRNCNNAGKQARGRHILLLNNDTVVLPGWLEALYRTIQQDPSIAIVGSKLLYPDGYIQEAGGGLLSNADGVSIGRWLWVGERNFPVRRREPLFNIERETDYISGASILVRKSFWDSIGGFDERYQNAYCEDSDLAMTARSKGLRVVYQPASEVIHFEHQSYSEQVSADHERLQMQNKQLLIEKWHDAFERDHLPQGSRWYQVAAHGERAIPPAVLEHRKKGPLNVLYFSPFPSHPSNHGNQATIQQFGKRFQSLGHKVHFALLQSTMYSPQAEQAMRDAWNTFDSLPNSHPLGANGAPIPFDGWYEEGLGERIRLLCAKYEIDIVFCSYVFQSKMLEYVPAYILKVIDTHDKMGDRYEMLRNNGQPLEFFSCTPEEEGAYLRRADVVVARRAAEAQYFDSVTGRNTAIVVPHVEDPHFVQREFAALSNVGMVASANRINLAIVRECLDAIDRQLGGKPCPFTVHIAGQVKDMALDLPANESAAFHKPWVRMHGFVSDIADFYGEMDLIISPVTMGTGINVKTVQAMAYGMPLLTTTCGSKGIESGELLHAHENLDQLAASLFKLIDQPTELARLAAISRVRFISFYDEALLGFKGIFANPMLSGAKPWESNVINPSKAFQINKNDPKFTDEIFQCLFAYYRKGERANCITVHNADKVRMDGSGAPLYIKETISSKRLHDEDFSIFRAFSESSAVILDIGANWGYSVGSVWAVSPKSKVISFEPILSYKEGLQEIKKLNPDQYDFRMLGLGNATEEVTFVVPVVNGIAISALASASKPLYDAHMEILAKNILDHILRWMPEVETVEFSLFEFSAPIERLDKVLSKNRDLIGELNIDAMKIDVEGYEADVLMGAANTLKKYKPLVMLEGGNRHKGLPEFMEALGYRYAERVGEILQAIDGYGTAINGFFVHRDKLKYYQQAGVCNAGFDMVELSSK
jgi:FkbM family methyltransferase